MASNSFNSLSPSPHKWTIQISPSKVVLTFLSTNGSIINLICSNSLLQSQQSKFSLPNPTKTGTTIAGIVFKDGVVLGADTRSTNDTTVADKNCEKIHYIAPHIYCCGAGSTPSFLYITFFISISSS